MNRRRAARIAGGLLALIVLLCLVAVAVNWRDAAPSPTAVRFQERYHSRPVIPDEENAAVFVFDFESGAEDTPRRNPEIETFFQTCRFATPACAAAFDGWAASESASIGRYQQLLAYTAWRETVPTDPAAPFPAYQTVMDGQRFLLLNARTLAIHGDYGDAQRLLSSDIRFWRMVLTSSDLLISKMIAVAAIRRHFEWASLILRKAPPDKAPLLIPSEWHAQITKDERSLERCMIGEWIFIGGSLRANDASATLESEGFPIAFRPLFKLEDTLNRYAEFHSSIVKVLDVPLDQYQAAVQALERLQTEPMPPRSAYNVIGRTLVAVAAGSYVPYARRVGDVEGIRRAALVAATVRESSAAAGAGVDVLLSEAVLRDPYNGKPFTHDAQARAVIFHGLDSGDRGIYRLYY